MRSDTLHPIFLMLCLVKRRDPVPFDTGRGPPSSDGERAWHVIRERCAMTRRVASSEVRTEMKNHSESEDESLEDENSSPLSRNLLSDVKAMHRGENPSELSQIPPESKRALRLS